MSLPCNKAEHTPTGAEGIGEEAAIEEKPPCEEKHVTSTPYLGVGSLRGLIGKPFDAGSQLGSMRVVSSGESFLEETGITFIGCY